MKVIGLLSWYDEDREWLADCVTSLAGFCDHLVAVDGAYAAFPGGKRASHSLQAGTISRAAADIGLNCTIHTPSEVWDGPWGGEVAKRNFMFQLAKSVTETHTGDWFFRIDADERITHCPSYVRDILQDIEEPVAEVLLWEDYPPQVAHYVGQGVSQTPLRALFRNVPYLRIEGAHWNVIADGDLGPAYPLWDLRVEHRTGQRSPERQRLKSEYNALIPDIEGVEDGP
ncbi:hypothetical protein JRC04_04875 [Mycolicibacterium sp. S2-37]|uniref:hypothetical protein n=1 Tax=Mycolicibacterium sp. S2-37 TaxID=2810297 RepID=UPI001A93C00A|nr:hypothetical protein [Mycolicibacterium sp. S2-37]MBO0676793.1 hypothetical protein [Mycolicibacterium sp. S2-37]